MSVLLTLLKTQKQVKNFPLLQLKSPPLTSPSSHHPRPLIRRQPPLPARLLSPLHSQRPLGVEGGRVKRVPPRRCCPCECVCLFVGGAGLVPWPGSDPVSQYLLGARVGASPLGPDTCVCVCRRRGTPVSPCPGMCGRWGAVQFASEEVATPPCRWPAFLPAAASVWLLL